MLAEEGFFYRGHLYPFEDVVETARFRHRLETRFLFVGSDFTNSISVIFSIRTGERVQLTEQPTWFSRGRPENVERIEHIFAAVSEMTFQARLQKYLKQLQGHQFFEYAGWQFHPANQTIINTETKRVYSTVSARLRRNYGFIEVQEGPDGIAATIGRSIRKRVGISTLRDADVLFALLNRFFGLAWQ